MNTNDAGSQSSQGAIKTSPSRARMIGSGVRTLLVSGIGFLADAYDLLVIDFVVAVLAATSFTPPTTAQKGLITSATLVGSIIGQLGFGFAADIMGRRIMFISTAALVILGSFVSSLVGIGYEREPHQAFNVFYQLALVRFILGVGIGGEYPLSATVTSEAKSRRRSLNGSVVSTLSNGSRDHATAAASSRQSSGCCWFLSTQPNSVACVFSMQGVGMLLSPLLVLILIKSGVSLEATWRICLGLGALPSAVAFYFRWKMSEPASSPAAGNREQQTAAPDELASSSSTNYRTLVSLKSFNEKRHMWGERAKDQRKSLRRFAKYLIGTGFTWFLIDVTFYGTGSFKSTVVNEWFADSGADDGAMPICESTVASDKASQAASTNFQTAGTPIWRPLTFPKSHQRYNRQLAAMVVRRLKTTSASAAASSSSAVHYSSQTLSFLAKPAAAASFAAESTATTTLSGTPPPRPLSVEQAAPTPNRSIVPPQPSSFIATHEGCVSLLQEAAGADARQKLVDQAVAGVVVALISVPGYLLSVLLIHRTGLRNLILYGFVAVAAAFACLAAVQFAHNKSIGLNLVLFGLTFLFTNFGPNTATFILPTTIYPSIIRATLHGFSAAMGKAGGAVGTNLFGPLNDSIGLGALLMCCAGVALLGAIVAYFFVPTDAAAKATLAEFESKQLQQQLRPAAGPLAKGDSSRDISPSTNLTSPSKAVELDGP